MIISGKYVKELREKAGLSQTELAKRVGITQAHIAKIETEKVDARLSTINKTLSVLESSKKQITCKNLMIKNIISVSPNDKVKKSIQLMRRYNFSQIPVIENKIVVGSVKESTIIKKLDPNLPQKRVKEIMEEPFPIINSEDSIDVAKALLDFHSAVLLSEKRKIVGIITKSDILKLIR